MKRKVFVDTAAWLALVNKSDGEKKEGNFFRRPYCSNFS
jgi:predicted nucleic acid-binding protein